jgi:ribosomal protein S18 acetylase RimI-like enzyme
VVPTGDRAAGAGVEVRRLVPADADAWWALRLRALRDHPGAFGASYEEARDRPVEERRRDFATRSGGPERLILGACLPAGGPLAGSVGCLREDWPKERHKASIWGMYVAPEARGRGVGQALLGAAVEQARRWEGVEQIHLAGAADNDAARRLYRAAGFVVWGREPHALKLPDRYVDEEHMVLVLA